MVLPQSVLSILLAAFRFGDGVDLIRDSVRVALQVLIELEATERICGAVRLSVGRSHISLVRTLARHRASTSTGS